MGILLANCVAAAEILLHKKQEETRQFHYKQEKTTQKRLLGGFVMAEQEGFEPTGKIPKCIAALVEIMLC